MHEQCIVLQCLPPGLKIGLFRFSLSFNPCFPAFYTSIACLQILYTANFLIEPGMFLFTWDTEHCKFSSFISSITEAQERKQNWGSPKGVSNINTRWEGGGGGASAPLVPMHMDYKSM